MNTVSDTVRVNTERLWADLMKIAEFTEPERPYTRRSFSPLFLQARQWLADRFQDAGLQVCVDAAGNLRGRLPGGGAGTARVPRAPAGKGAGGPGGGAGGPGGSAAGPGGSAGTIMLGSHSDTVLDGGRFDGIAGVIAALEIARAFAQSPHKLQHDLEIVDFLAEEPNPFGLSCVGSRGMVGALDEKMLAYTEPGGETLAQAIERVGGNPAQLASAKPADLKAFFELHIEQGPVLEQQNIDIGVVTGIVGIRRFEIIFEGETDHAGTTPMNMRRDAAVAMAEAMVAIRQLADDYSQAGQGHFVATCGIVEVLPGAANVVPRLARTVIDARSESRELMDGFTEKLKDATREIAERLRVDVSGFNILSDSLPSKCADELQNIIAASASELKLSNIRLASGAGHDAAFLSRIAPMAMVFVPCRKGKSHAAEEWSEAQQLANGANVICEAICRLDVL